MLKVIKFEIFTYIRISLARRFKHDVTSCVCNMVNAEWRWIVVLLLYDWWAIVTHNDMVRSNRLNWRCGCFGVNLLLLVSSRSGSDVHLKIYIKCLQRCPWLPKFYVVSRPLCWRGARPRYLSPALLTWSPRHYMPRRRGWPALATLSLMFCALGSL